MKVEALATRISNWGEGPVWWKGHLYYVDIEGHALVQYDPEKGSERVWNLDQQIGFALPCESGRWIWGGEKGLFFLDLETGVSSPLVDPESDLPDNRFNDAAISPDGRLFAGTIAMNKISGNASLYRIDSDLDCSLVIPNVTNSNGIDWSPDGSICYYIDTPTKKIRKYAYDFETGELSGEQVVLNTEGLYTGSPDGMTADAEGFLWVAFCHGGCVVKLDPESGNELAKIDLPAAETTSCCFGGAEGRDLFITTGVNSKEEEEHGGKVFIIKNAGEGNPQIPFADNSETAPSML